MPIFFNLHPWVIKHQCQSVLQVTIIFWMRNSSSLGLTVHCIIIHLLNILFWKPCTNDVSASYALILCKLWQSRNRQNKLNFTLSIAIKLINCLLGIRKQFSSSKLLIQSVDLWRNRKFKEIVKFYCLQVDRHFS